MGIMFCDSMGNEVKVIDFSGKYVVLQEHDSAGKTIDAFIIGVSSDLEKSYEDLVKTLRSKHRLHAPYAVGRYDVTPESKELIRWDSDGFQKAFGFWPPQILPKVAKVLIAAMQKTAG